MPDLPLSHARTVELLTEVVAEFGEDYVYRKGTAEPVRTDGAPCTCFYVRDDRPSCIVAHVLHRAGVSLDDLRTVEGWTPIDQPAADKFGRWAEPAARDLLWSVQDDQDAGVAWGRAVRDGLENFGGSDE